VFHAPLSTKSWRARGRYTAKFLLIADGSRIAP